MRFITLTAVAALAALTHTAIAQTAAPTAPAGAPAATAPAVKPDRGGPQDPETRARWEKFQAACGADLKTHCGAISSQGEQRRTEMRQCVDTHKAKFSSACQTAINERDAARAARKDAKDAKPAADKPKS